jgi:hypothetical protein
VISAKAMKILRQFSTSYLCEQVFSCLTDIKSKDRNRLLSVEEELGCVFQKLCQEFNICVKRNKLKYHIKSDIYSDFGCQLYFDVQVQL